ncbi:MAG TPA: hypothetical protein DCY94_02380 [Firmicutes bacterium]|nr:hypothetical protein [Bacillota bacterium]
MIYYKLYHSPIGDLVIKSDGKFLGGLDFKKDGEIVEETGDVSVFEGVCEWLDAYFEGTTPKFTPKIRIEGVSAFTRLVIEELEKIPYGKLTTYKEIARRVAKKMGKEKMSSQAIGGAVGRNPIAIIIPCHRVIGSNLSLVGYAGGLDKKVDLLKIEGHDFAVPKEIIDDASVNKKKRCKWCNLRNPLYVEYHDSEWGVLNLDSKYLFEMLILEAFQAGLSWECVLNKRAAFKEAYDDFDVDKVSQYGQDEIERLASDVNIIRNKRKIIASIENAKIFKKIEEEFGSFKDYLYHFTKGNVIYENDRVTSELSDKISKDLQKRGMKFVGSTIIYSFLQAVGLIVSHDDECFLHQTKRT